MRRNLRIFISLLAVATGAFAQQQPPFSERVDVNAVLIDAVVTDQNGNQILGLTKDDFVVTENGVEQTIDSVDYFTTRQLLNAREGSTPFNVERVREERYFVFFVDKAPNAEFFGRLAQFRKDVMDFVKNEMRAGDYVAVVGHDVRLKVYADFTTDRRQIEKGLEEAMKLGRGVLDAPQGNGPSILRNVDRKRVMNETGTTYEALEALADALQPIRARKNLVLVSPVIIEQGEDIRNGVLLNESRYYKPMIDALNAANVTVYGVNLMENAPQDPVYHQTLDRITRETNGEYFRYATTFRQPLREVAKASAGYYLITYRTQHAKGEKGFQKVDVRVKQPEFRVKARTGYTFGS
jgi:VWFA-related protein